jgi:hypothetical protein
MSYFVASTSIIDYIESILETNALNEEGLKIALAIADRFVNDGKTKPKTPTLRKSRELLEKLKR